MHETINMLLPLAGILLGAKAAAQLSHRLGYQQFLENYCLVWCLALH